MLFHLDFLLWYCVKIAFPFGFVVYLLLARNCLTGFQDVSKVPERESDSPLQHSYNWHQLPEPENENDWALTPMQEYYKKEK